MNISNINNFIKVKNDILKWFAHAVAQATDVSVAWARIYRWRNERSEFFITGKLYCIKIQRNSLLLNKHILVSKNLIRKIK